MINLDEFNAYELICNDKIVATYSNVEAARKAMWKLNDDIRGKHDKKYRPCVYINYIKAGI